jgi:hypothetical protein
VVGDGRSESALLAGVEQSPDRRTHWVGVSGESMLDQLRQEVSLNHNGVLRHGKSSEESMRDRLMLCHRS